MHQYYPSNYEPYVGAIQDERWILRRIARRFSLHLKINFVYRLAEKRKGTILDIGCSTGVFIDGMRARGWDVFGIDINKEAISHARDRFGLNVFQGDLLDTKFNPGQFDVVTAWDVLEHTYNPIKVLVRIHDLLNDDGVLILRIPNWESIDRIIFQKYWIGYDTPRHLFVFTRTVLHSMLEKAGFYDIRIRRGFGGYFSFLASIKIWLNNARIAKNIKGIIISILDFPGIRVLFLPWFAITDGFSIAGDLIVSAKKISWCLWSINEFTAIYDKQSN
ncbi:MAG: class I SAM-dependent methyltransferase [Anaerolineaceae bacterium]|nr:class I SAM-dependent methyltransferase [Anaerolineaceae bacterium]